MADIVEISEHKREEMEKGLLYKAEKKIRLPTGLVEDRTLREGIDAATTYLESKGRGIRTIISQKTLILTSLGIGFLVGALAAFALILLWNPEGIKSLIGI